MLVAWAGGQPWLTWPGLAPAVCQRLTLVLCACAMGVVTCTLRLHQSRPLPRWLVWPSGSLLTVMAVHQWPIIQDASYFEVFRETAALSDGILVILACLWGVWAVGQLPVSWLRRLRWIGLVGCVLHVAFAIPQHLHSPYPWSATGWLGTDRDLGAYAVIWLPIFTVWHGWLAVLPLGLILLSGKVTAWIGAAVVLCRLHPARWPWWVGLALVALIWCAPGKLVTFESHGRWSKLHQRVRTWTPILRSTAAHPLVGHSFSPMAYSLAQQRYGAWLPSIHSDWLSVAFHAGWIVWGVCGLSWMTIVRAPPVSAWSRGLQAGCLGIGVMMVGQAVVSPSVAGLLLLCLAWLWVEQQEIRV